MGVFIYWGENALGSSGLSASTRLIPSQQTLKVKVRAKLAHERKTGVEVAGVVQPLGGDGFLRVQGRDDWSDSRQSATSAA